MTADGQFPRTGRAIWARLR